MHRGLYVAWAESALELVGTHYVGKNARYVKEKRNAHKLNVMIEDMLVASNFQAYSYHRKFKETRIFHIYKN